MNALVERKDGAAATLMALASKLDPATDTEIREAVVRMLAAFSVGSTSDKAHAEMLIRTYTAALRGQPLWAITGAAQSFLRGSVEGHNAGFRPTPPQWVKEAERACEGIYSEMRWQRAKLPDPPQHEIAPEKRTELFERFKALRSTIGAKDKADPVGERGKSPAQLLAELEALKTEPVEVSPTLLKLIKEQTEDEATMRDIRDRVAAVNGHNERKSA